MEYDELEGVLYDLRGGRRRAGQYSRPRLTPGRPPRPGPRTLLTPPGERRVDVSHAMHRLTDPEVTVLDLHYSGQVPVSPRIRRPVVKKLLAVLRQED